MFIRRNIFVRKKEQEHLIQTVYPGSIAEELEIEPGDVLLKINGQKIEDVFDYRYLMKDEYVEVLIRKPSGKNGFWKSIKSTTMNLELNSRMD